MITLKHARPSIARFEHSRSLCRFGGCPLCLWQRT